MLKKFFNIMKRNSSVEKEDTEVRENIKEIKEEVLQEEVMDTRDDTLNSNEIEVTQIEEKEIKVEENSIVSIEDIQHNDIEEELSKEDEEYIKEAKIKRGKGIRAIDVYNEEILEFKNHIECSKKLKLPINYIKENLIYGHTDYFGQAIEYLSKELNLKEEDYLKSNKTPVELYNYLNNKIFTAKISEQKRDEILCSENIDPVKMHYKFECIDEEYDIYYKKYKSIIKRGGKKKIELVDKKGEAIEIFKSLDDCASYLEKEKDEIVNMLKYNETKVGRYEIRYSLRNI